MRALIVEDERFTRNELAEMIREDGRLTVTGEAATVQEAIALLRRFEPDVVFLDIHLGSESGFDLLEHCPAQEVIFVTAHDEHAIRAFEVNALDYLLKPISPARLNEAIGRAIREQSPLVHAAGEPFGEHDRLFLRLGDDWAFLRIGDIATIEAEGNYSRVRTLDGVQRLNQKSLQEWEARLPARRFARVHRSTIVNIAAVERVVEWSNYAFRITVDGSDQPVIMSRRYAARLKRLLG